MTNLPIAAMAATLAGAGLCAGGDGEAREAPSTPLLRLETGVHGADITGLAADARRGIIATSSYDKTIRIWRPGDRNARPRVLRVPIAPGREGRLYAVALSPDGRRVVASGWTGSWDARWSLYVFDVESGRLERRVADLPHRAMALAFSPDGNFLAAGLKAGEGIVVYDTRDWSVAARDADQGDDVPSLDFDGEGRLVVVALDGSVTLYSADFRRRRTIEASGEGRPAVARFAPDGRVVALGYADAGRVDLLDARDLALVARADSRGIDKGITALAWSADGAFLYGAGFYERGGVNPIRRWAKGGRGEWRDLPGPNGDVTHLRALADGALAFATQRGALGIIARAGRVTWERRLAAADFRDQQEVLRVSPDGANVEFAFERFGGKLARFSLAARRIVADAMPGEELDGARTEAPGLAVRDWRDGYRPTLNGRPLALRRHERALSLAIAPGEKRFLLGTAWRVICFDATGRERWSVSAPSEALAVTVSRDGRFVIAAFADGTIRWLRLADGAGLLALFPHVDGKRWVAWTPSGYYMASAGGDRLVGWHVNRGKDGAGDFFTVSRFREIFYRPDIVERVLAVGDERRAIDRADAEAGRGGTPRDVAALLPPVVSVVSPGDGHRTASPRVTIVLEIRASSAALPEVVHVRADGRPIAEIRGGFQGGPAPWRRSVDVYIPRRDTIIDVIAETAAGVRSEAGSVRLEWAGPAESARPSLFVLAVGVSDYRAAELRLDLAAKDAGDFADVIRRNARGSYRRIEVRILRDGEASGRALEEALEWLSRVPTSRDVAMLFMAGHGVDDAAGRYFYVPQDVAPADVFRQGLSYVHLRRALGRIAGRALLFMDTCHSGAVWGRAADAAMDPGRIVNDLSSPELGVVVFASSTGNQLSYESPEWGNGAFTKAVVEGLGGKAALFGNRFVSISGLDAYVSHRVPRLTAGRQTPATGKPVGADFVLVRLAE